MASQSDRDKLFFKPLDDSADITSSTIGSFRIPGYGWSWPIMNIIYFKRIGINMAKEVMWESIKLGLKNIFPVTYLLETTGSQLHTVQYMCSRATTTIMMMFAVGESQIVRCEALSYQHPFVIRCSATDYSDENSELPVRDKYLAHGTGKIFHKISALWHQD
ncbi:hypothetical protein Aperf_G00000075920 [Anoplocephala perfoliata]